MSSSSKSNSKTGTKPPSTPPSGAKRAYLTLYNGVSCGLWAVILYKVVSLLLENYNKEPILAGTVKRKENVFYEVGEFVKIVQTGALLEVLHAAVGM